MDQELAIIEGEFTVVEEEKKPDYSKSVSCSVLNYCDTCGAIGGDCKTACVPMDFFCGG